MTRPDDQAGGRLDQSDSAGASDAWLAGLVPRRLGPAMTTAFPEDAHPALKTALGLQRLGSHAHLWEAAGAEENRMYEIAGCLAGIGEQLGLACASVRDYSGWETVEFEGQEAVEAEMAKRALAEIAAHYVLAAGHGILNVVARTVALDTDLSEMLQHTLGTSFPPLSDTRGDWLSANRSQAQKLKRIANCSRITEMHHVADPIVSLTCSSEWDDLIEGRGADFHRWRVQTAGICGAAKRSPWKHGDGVRSMELSFGQVLNKENNARLAAEMKATATAARDKLVAAVNAFMPRFEIVVGATTAMTLRQSIS